jgi:hypothetical protein
MSGQINTPGTITVEWIDREETTDYEVASGPWAYAEWLCWKPADSPHVTTYAPLRNVATWEKVDTIPNREGSIIDA